MSSSFYERSPDKALRFGDVVRGFPMSASRVESPILGDVPTQYKIDVTQTEYAVILTPCCSIRDETLLLSPLEKIQPRFYANPYFEQDLLRVNYPTTCQQSVPPNQWERMTGEQRAARFDMSKRTDYRTFLSLFVYAADDLLREYDVHRKDGKRRTAHYMIDFRRIHRIDCKKIKRPEEYPLEAKVLQITIEAREALREKLAAYFARVPPEDRL